MFPRLGLWRLMKHVNIPIFIPHLGCPNGCVFCNQRSISGKESFNIEAMEQEIRQVLSTVTRPAEVEIAFFGGSFTGIDRDLMVALLERAEHFVREGSVDAIRLSTRPDYIDGEVLEILSRYSVKTIELGLQSMDDGVLAAAKRGHTAEDGKRACALVKQYGFSLIGQMMVGLPASDSAREIETAKALCDLAVDGVRVYPTVVFEDTELCDMARCGEYIPLSDEEAVMRTKEVLRVFDSFDVPCIRVGLCASENLSDETAVYGGANHSAIGELAMGELYYEKICEWLDKNPEKRGPELVIYGGIGTTSKISGQNKRNKTRICKKYGISKIKILEKSEIIGYNIILDTFMR